MIISIIAAMDRNNLIGRRFSGLPWHLPADLKHFKELTMGKPVIMGRTTFETIGRPLPGRLNIVMTRDPDFAALGVEVAGGVEGALTKAAEAEEVMVIGGAEIYRQFLPMADRLYLTRLDATFRGDIYFPEVNWNAWREVSREFHQSDEKNPYAYTFLTYEKI